MNGRKSGKTWSKTSVQNLVKHRSGAYYSRLFIGGKERWKSLRTTVLEVARVRLREEQRESDRTVPVAKPPRSGRMTMAMAIETLTNDISAHVPMRRRGRKSEITESSADYRRETVKSLFRTWQQVTGDDLGAQEVRKITVNQVRNWADAQRKDLSATRFNNTLGTLRRLFAIAIQAGELHRDPSAEIARSYKEPKTTYTPTREEFLKLIKSIRESHSRLADDVADYVEFLAYTGARREEGACVLWSDIDLERERVTFRKTKNGLARTNELIPLACSLVTRIMQCRESRLPGERVFRVSQAYGSLRAAATRIGIPRISHHDLRDLFATTAIESGADIPTVADWLGHKDGGALLLERYRKRRGDHARQAAKRVSFDPL